MSKLRYDYTVIEDNGGGLHLFIFRKGTDKIVAAFDGFEYSLLSLVITLDGLDDGATRSQIMRWDGQKQDAGEQWDYIQSHDLGYEVICYGNQEGRTVKPERMGAAGKREFGIAEE